MLTRRHFYYLLRVALQCPPEGCTAPEFGTLTAEDWRQLLELSRSQTVTGLVYAAISSLPEAGSMPEQVSTRFMMEAEAIARFSKKVDGSASELLQSLSEAGFSPVLMKGPDAARFYPVPELRTGGDIDLMLPRGETRPAAQWFRDRGLNVSFSPDGSFTSTFSGIQIDVHQHYFDLHCKPELLPEIPSAEATLLMLSAHILKHAMGLGVGMRQICDMAMALRGLQGRYDSGRFLTYLSRTGTLRWTSLLCSFINSRLGIGSGLFPDNCSQAEISRLEGIIFGGGNFGHHDASRKRIITGASAARRKADTFARMLRRAPFALKYAPREYFIRILEYSLRITDLFKGNLK